MIDPLHGTMTLPPQFGRSEPVPVPFHTVVDVDIERVVEKDKDDRETVTYFPRVTWIDEANEKKQHARLVEWTDLALAERFVTWLREQIRFTD